MRMYGTFHRKRRKKGRTIIKIQLFAVLFLFSVVGVTYANPVVPNGQISLQHGTYPVNYSDKTNAGVDIKASCGSQIIAFGDGVVSKAIVDSTDSKFPELGYAIIVEHPAGALGDKFFTLYINLADVPFVKVGEQVKGGKTVIGEVGTNKDMVCQTHFEVRRFADFYNSDWGGLYGKGDQRKSDTFQKNWEDPLVLFNKYPEGISRGPTAPPYSPTGVTGTMAGSTPAVPSGVSTGMADKGSTPTVVMGFGNRKSSSQDISSLTTKVFASPNCEQRQKSTIANSVGVIIFHENGLMRVYHKDQPEYTAEINNQNNKVCDDLPSKYYALFGEAIALFKESEGIGKTCVEQGETRCLERVFDFADVHKDGQLTPAELARVARAIGFFIGYKVALADNERKGKVRAVEMGAVAGPVVLSNLLVPFLVDSLIKSYDFDASGSVSLAELQQDRGSSTGDGAVGSVSFAAADAAADVLLKGIMSMAPQIMGLLP